MSISIHIVQWKILSRHTPLHWWYERSPVGDIDAALDTYCFTWLLDGMQRLERSVQFASILIMAVQFHKGGTVGMAVATLVFE